VLKADAPSEAVLLGSENAEKSFVLGEPLIDNLIQIVDALTQVLQTGANSGGPVVFAGLPVWQQLWAAPQVGLKALLQQPGVVLSIRVKGE
jgi:hypothetical protein